MKKISFIAVSALLIALSNPTKSNAQCDTIASLCARHIVSSFISDGQLYRALLLNPDETAEFKTTFFGETVYRLAGCSGLNDGNLIFSIFDLNHELLFTNKDFKNAPYWDFKVKSTVDITIEAKLDPSNNGSGCAVLLIGFRQAKK